MTATELRRRRRQLGLTQAELASALSVPQQTISRWETGAIEIQHPLILHMALNWLADDLARLRTPEARAAHLATWTARDWAPAD